MLESKSVAPMYLLQFKDSAGEWSYAADRDGSRNFTEESVLKFQQAGERGVADVDLAVPSLTGSIKATRPLRIQVIRDSGRVWVRVGE